MACSILKNNISLKIFILAWTPVLINWLILALESPLINLILLHYNINQTFIINFNIAYAFLFLVEAPIIMLNMLSISLIDNYYNYTKVLKAASLIMIATIIFFLGFLYSPLFSHIFSHHHINGITTNYVHIRKLCFLILAIAIFIGYKRIFQGILFVNSSYHSILYASITRIFMTIILLIFGLRFLSSKIDPDFASIAILSCVILIEAGLTHLFSIPHIKKLPKLPHYTLSYKKIIYFFYPLSLTSIISLITFPILTFYMILFSDNAAELMDFQLAFSIIVPFRSIPMSLQEIVVPFLKTGSHLLSTLKKYFIYIASTVTMISIIMLIIPTTSYYFFELSHIPKNSFSYINELFCILFLYPLTTFIVIWQRSIHINNHATNIFTLAAIAELTIVIMSALGLYFFLYLDMGTSGSLALVLGRCVSILFLWQSTTPKYSYQK